MTGDRIAIVGCGAQKVDTDTPLPVARLYTSTYFKKKQEYAKTCCDQYYILSAKLGLVTRDTYALPYDLTIDDLNEDELAEWVETVRDDLLLVTEDDQVETVVWLAGQSYFDPLTDALTECCEHAALETPFARTEGIGEQMRWLTREIARVSDGRNAGQSSLEMYAGGEP